MKRSGDRTRIITPEPNIHRQANGQNKRKWDYYKNNHNNITQPCKSKDLESDLHIYSISKSENI